jgi:hypothetical protein
MKTTLFISILFYAIALPVFGELTETDLNKIRLVIEEELKPIKADIVTLQTDVAWVRGKLDGIDKQITHGTNITYGLMALIVAAVVIPQILIMLRSGRDRALERQVEMLTQEVETLKQQRIVNP